MKNEKITNNKIQKVYKERFFVKYLFVLILSLFLLSCQDIFEMPQPEQEAPPSDYGSFSLNIVGVNLQARTILPSISNDTFVGYTLKFINTTTLAEQIFYCSTDNLTVNLEAGTYNLVVIAFTQYTDAENNKPAARGELDNIAILSGKSVTGEIVLRILNVIDSEKGVFNWNIGLPDNLSEVYMEIISYSSGIMETWYFVGGEEINRISNSGSLELNSDYYYVVFILKKDDNTRLVFWRETLHIYQNMTSHFNYDFTNYHFITNSYMVRFVYNNGNDDREESYFYNDFPAPVPPSREGYTFGGWYTDENFNDSDKWFFDTSLTDDIILYAQWIPSLITYTVTPNGSSTTSSTELAFNFSKDPGNISINDITVTNGTGSAIVDTLIGTGNNRTLIIIPNSSGILNISILFDGIESDIKDVFIYAIFVDAQTPLITIQPQNAIYNLFAGDMVQPLAVAASVTDGGTLSFQWYRNTENSTNGGIPIGNNSSNYIPIIANEGTLYYYVVVTNTVNNTNISRRTSNVVAITVFGNWTSVLNSPFTNNINSIVYGNGLFIAGGIGGRIAYSSNGISCSSVSNSTFGTDWINSIAYGNNMFVAVGRNGKMAYSNNGITWTAVSNSTFGTDSINSIIFGNNKFVAVGDNGKIAYSSNGITWTAISNSNYVFRTIDGIAFGNGKFVAVGSTESAFNGPMYSIDGITWTQFVSNTPTNISSAHGIAYGNDMFLAITNQSNRLLYSNDGITWTSRIINIPFGYITTISYGNNKFVIGGLAGNMAQSSDGITWNDVSDINFGGNGVNSIVYGNGRFIAGGGSGKMSWVDWRENEILQQVIPAPPTISTNVIESASTNLISWTADPRAIGYRVYRSITGASGIYNLIGTTFSPVTQFRDIRLTNSTTYHYRVSAFNNDGESAQSSSILATTLEMNEQAFAISSSTIVIEWPLADDKNDVTMVLLNLLTKLKFPFYSGIGYIGVNYVIDRRSSLQNDWYRVASIPWPSSLPSIPIIGVPIIHFPTSLEVDHYFVDTGLLPNTTYYYRVSFELYHKLPLLPAIVTGFDTFMNVSVTTPIQ